MIHGKNGHTKTQIFEVLQWTEVQHASHGKTPH